MRNKVSGFSMAVRPCLLRTSEHVRRLEEKRAGRSYFS